METHLTLKHATFFNLFLNVTTLNVILWEWVTLYTMCHNYGTLDHCSLSRHKLADDDSHQGDLEHSLAGSLPKHDWVSIFCWQKERGESCPGAIFRPTGRQSWDCACACTSVPSCTVHSPGPTCAHLTRTHTASHRTPSLPISPGSHYSDISIMMTTWDWQHRPASWISEYFTADIKWSFCVSVKLL